MHRPTKTTSQYSNYHKMVNEADIQAAISDLKSQKTSNIAQTAKKHNIQKTTLLRRFKGETVSNIEARSKNQKLLINVQERILIDHIRKLSDRGLHPTPKIFENLIVELVKHPIGER